MVRTPTAWFFGDDWHVTYRGGEAVRRPRVTSGSPACRNSSSALQTTSWRSPGLWLWARISSAPFSAVPDLGHVRHDAEHNCSLITAEWLQGALHAAGRVLHCVNRYGRNPNAKFFVSPSHVFVGLRAMLRFDPWRDLFVKCAARPPGQHRRVQVGTRGLRFDACRA